MVSVRHAALCALFAVALLGGLAGNRAATSAPGNPRAQQIGLSLRAVFPLVGRDVYPDVAVEALVVTTGGRTDVTYLFRIRNIGDAEVEFSRYTIQAWFSADAVLQKDLDLPGSILGGATLLRPGDVFEASTTATNGDAIDTRYPWLVLEVDAANTVVEADFANNVLAVRRPPQGLVTEASIAWDLPLQRAVVSWVFNGEELDVPDLGFRVEVPGFGTQTVGAGIRSIVVRFDPLTGARPCVAKVSPLTVEGYAWPAVTSNDLCPAP